MPKKGKRREKRAQTPYISKKNEKEEKRSVERPFLSFHSEGKKRRGKRERTSPSRVISELGGKIGW